MHSGDVKPHCSGHGQGWPGWTEPSWEGNAAAACWYLSSFADVVYHKFRVAYVTLNDMLCLHGMLVGYF